MTSCPIPKPVYTSAPIHDRKSTFVAAIYRAASPAAAQATVKHVKNVVHASNPASHNMMAYRTMSLKSGRSGLHGPEDFEVRGKSIDLHCIGRQNHEPKSDLKGGMKMTAKSTGDHEH